MKKLIGIVALTLILLFAIPANINTEAKDKPVTWHSYVCSECCWSSGCTTATYFHCPNCLGSSMFVLSCKPVL